MGDISLQRIKSAGDELAKLVEMTIEELVKQLRKSKNAKVKTAVMHTFAQLAHVLPKYTAEGIDKFLPDLEKLVNEAASYELILDTLSIFRRLFKSEDEKNSKFQKYYQ
jgi:transcriptional antiterminator